MKLLYKPPTKDKGGHYDLLVIGNWRHRFKGETVGPTPIKAGTMIKDTAMVPTGPAVRRKDDRHYKAWRQRARPTPVEEDGIELLLEMMMSQGASDEQAQEIARILQTENPWDILQVTREATLEACAAPYRTKSLLLHPDKCGHAKAVEAFRNSRKRMNGPKTNHSGSRRNLMRNSKPDVDGVITNS